jgi:hypothetical protein
MIKNYSILWLLMCLLYSSCAYRIQSGPAVEHIHKAPNNFDESLLKTPSHVLYCLENSMYTWNNVAMPSQWIAKRLQVLSERSGNWFGGMCAKADSTSSMQSLKAIELQKPQKTRESQKTQSSLTPFTIHLQVQATQTVGSWPGAVVWYLLWPYQSVVSELKMELEAKSSKHIVLQHTAQHRRTWYAMYRYAPYSKHAMQQIDQLLWQFIQNLLPDLYTDPLQNHS